MSKLSVVVFCLQLELRSCINCIRIVCPIAAVDGKKVCRECLQMYEHVDYPLTTIRRLSCTVESRVHAMRSMSRGYHDSFSMA